MSSLKNKLQQDQIRALKNHDQIELDILRFVIAQIKNKEIEKKADLSDEEVIMVLRKQAKELQESIDSAKRANRPDLIEYNEKQLSIINSYLPQD